MVSNVRDLCHRPKGETYHVGVDDCCSVRAKVFVLACHAGEDLAGLDTEVDDAITGEGDRDWWASVGTTGLRVSNHSSQMWPKESLT